MSIKKRNTFRKQPKNKKSKKCLQKTYKMQKGGKLMCSPIARTKTVKKGATCFTPDILLKIKNEFNKKNPENPIHTNEVREIWKQLHDRLNSTKCKGKNELCWLTLVDNAEMRAEIKDKLFAPKQPDEWKQNPDEWLSNFDIFNVIEQYEDVDEYHDFKALLPTSIDFDSKRTGTSSCVSEELCKFSLANWLKKGKKRFGFVFNLDKHTGPGSHWVTLFVDTVNSFMFFFDSAGDGVPNEVDKLMKRIEKQGDKLNIHFKIYDNDHNDHQKGNTECGMYSLFFMITMLTGKIPSNPYHIMPVDERIQLFLEKKIPDKIVFDYRDLYFNPDL